MIHREGMVFRHDWEVPSGAVLDCLLGQRDGIDADRVALMGMSTGGYLAPRTAAFGSRIKAVAFDGCFDLGENFLAALPGSSEEKVTSLLADSGPEIDQLLDKVKSSNPAHPFTAPANRPRTRCFCRKKNMSAIGIMVNNEAPSLRGNWLPEDRPPFTRLARPVVSVSYLGEIVAIKKNWNWFHDAWNEMIVRGISPGRTAGSTIFQ